MPSQPPPFVVSCSHPGVMHALAAMARGTNIPVVVQPTGGQVGVEPASGPTRLRLGAVMDWLIDRAAWSAEQLPDQVSLSTGVFQPHIGQYMPASGSAVRLTEKEVEFLKALYQAPGRTLAKSVLLDVVWGYVPGVETHTLETHVYRLRQKIERDPANPQLLVTLDGAYALRV